MEAKIYVVDRIEGEYAVCIPEDGGKKLDIPAPMIPNAKEGLRLEIAFRDDSFKIAILEDSSRRDINQNRLRKLFNKSECGSNED